MMFLSNNFSGFHGSCWSHSSLLLGFAPCGGWMFNISEDCRNTYPLHRADPQKSPSTHASSWQHYTYIKFTVLYNE